ncbi:MAG: ABATE domain-containing protein [Thermomicrobiales bacterium]|nr:ABATE domain-containing protein [Thermomicrobiales bacterium]
MADEGSATTQQFAFIGGALCLDFSNTADWHASATPTEMLPDYDALLVWAVEAGILSADDTTRLRVRAVAEPEEAAAVMRRAVALREVIYRLFSRIAAGNEVVPADLATLNDQLAITLPFRMLTHEANGFTWSWRSAGLDAPLMLITASAADLLTSPTLDRVRECDGHPCGWLFIDTSRNRSRRWCSMESCGNRAKARRHYQRSRGAATEGI